MIKDKLEPLEIIEKIVEFTNKTSPKYTNIEEDIQLINKLKKITKNLTENFHNFSILEANGKEDNKNNKLYTLNEFITDLILLNSYEDNEEIIEESKNKNNNTIKLMTLHCAKGLKFSNVFIVGVENRYYPLYSKTIISKTKT